MKSKMTPKEKNKMFVRRKILFLKIRFMILKKKNLFFVFDG